MKTLGIIGLGRMGASIARRCARAGALVWGYDPYVQVHVGEGVVQVATLPDLLARTSTLLIMVPAGDAVDEVLAQIIFTRAQRKLPDDLVIIDGGNSWYKDSVRRHELLANDGIHFLDMGISGGLQGETEGYCLMVGGLKRNFTAVHPVLALFAAGKGIVYTGPAGSGHYAKMVHNGIEYGILQAYAEGMQLASAGAYTFDLAALTAAWQHGSVVRSHILSLLNQVMADTEVLASTSGVVHENGTGRWMLQAARDQHLQLPVIEAAVRRRSWSRETGGDEATKIVSLLRHAFGGHHVEVLVQPLEEKERHDA